MICVSFFWPSRSFRFRVACPRWRKLPKFSYLQVMTRTLWMLLRTIFSVQYVICRLRNLFKRDVATDFVKDASGNIWEGALLLISQGWNSLQFIMLGIVFANGASVPSRLNNTSLKQKLRNTRKNPIIAMFLFLFCLHQFACAYSIGLRCESLNKAYFENLITIINKTF